MGGNFNPGMTINLHAPVYRRKVGGAAAIVGTAIAIIASAAAVPAFAIDRASDRARLQSLEKPVLKDAAPVAGLPHAGGRSFASLDAYLAHLRAYAAPIDKPWYREVKPGVFMLQRGNLRPLDPPPSYTREELEKKFGFAR